MNDKVKVAIGAIVGGLIGLVVGCKVADKVYPETTTTYGPEELKGIVDEFFNFED